MAHTQRVALTETHTEKVAQRERDGVRGRGGDTECEKVRDTERETERTWHRA